MDKPKEALLIEKWEEAKRNLDEVEAELRACILESKKSWTVGGVRVVYNKGRKTYNYKEVGSDAPEPMVEKYTSIRTSVDWRKLVLEGMCMEQDMVPFTRSAPSVTLKIDNE